MWLTERIRANWRSRSTSDEDSKARKRRLEACSWNLGYHRKSHHRLISPLKPPCSLTVISLTFSSKRLCHHYVQRSSHWHTFLLFWILNVGTFWSLRLRNHNQNQSDLLQADVTRMINLQLLSFQHNSCFLTGISSKESHTSYITVTDWIRLQFLLIKF